MEANWDVELSRRISSAWAAFNEYRHILKTPSFPMRYKAKIFHAVILPRLLYGSESWALSKKNIERLRVVQRKMERGMLNKRIQDRLPSAVIRGITRLTDVATVAAKHKLNFAYRIAHMPESRWSLVVSEWCPYNRKSSPGRPIVRWRDELVEAVRSYNTAARRGRIRPAPIRGEEILRACRDIKIWRAV